MPEPLRLVVNCRPLAPNRIGGLENAFRGVLGAMLARFPDRLAVTLLTTPACDDSFGPWSDVVRRVPLGLDVAESYARELPEHDVLWCPFMDLEPVRPPIPSVVTIPDLQHRTYPEFFSRDALAGRLRRCRRSVGHARRVLTISEFSRRELIDAYHLPDEHVVVTHLDCGSRFHEPPVPGAVERVRAKYGLPERFALFPANAWPHKNHRGLFRALARYREEFGDPPTLVLTGVADLGAMNLDEEILALGLAGCVQHLGFAERADLPALYDAADMLLFVTLFEGFGIPVVEAMRRGTPIVASDSASIPEIAGDCALLVDPTDPAAIAAAIHAVVTDPAAARERAARGRDRAARFSYDRAAERTFAVLEEVAAMPAEAPAAVAREARPKVFVVTPSYNQGRFLRATIDSVLAQDYPELEYFVADGGSTDDSVAILESYGDRVRWVSEPDGGQAAAINRAWRDTDAEIVTWLNSDDVYLDGAVRKGVRFLLDHPDCAMVYGRAWYTDVDGEFTEPYPVCEEFDRSVLAGNCFVCQPATFLRREVFEVIDLPDPSLRYCMDYDLWIRLSERFGVGFLDEFLATSRMYEENKTLGERDGVYQEIMAVARRHFGHVHSSWSQGYIEYKCRQVAKRLLRFVPFRIQRHIYERLWRREQGRVPMEVFEDGWVPRVATMPVRPDPDGWVTLECESPVWPFRRRLEIRISSRERELARHRVEQRGRFTIEVKVPERGLHDVRLTLAANRGFVPKLCGISEDYRQMSFRILAVRSGRAQREHAAP